MQKRTKLLAIVALAFSVVFLGGCRTAPVHNVMNAPVTSASGARTMEDVQAAILRAGAALGWRMQPDRPGHITGTLALRKHVAIVDIDYNPRTYSITYRESTNLDYDGTRIHSNYNGWIQNLDQGIAAQLSTM